MTNINNVTSRRDNGSMSSSFLEVTGQLPIITVATCPSTIREVCAACFKSHYTIKEATHFCPGCDRRGRYICGNCLKPHSIWCNKPEHKVQSLPVDRNSNTDYRYNTIEQSEQNRRKCLPRDFPVPTDSDYVERSRSRDFSVPTYNDYVNSPAIPLQSSTKRENVQRTTNYRGPKAGRSNPQNYENQYEHYTRRNHGTKYHIYCDPIKMPKIPDTNRRHVHDSCEWKQISTATTTSGHKNAERVNKKRKCCCIIQ